MADYKLQIKDGSGNPQELNTDSGSNGITPYHAISGAVDVNVTFPETQSVSFATSSVLTASIGNWPATQSVSFATSSVLTASISNFPATQSVSFDTGSALTASINNFPATQSVSFSTASILTASVNVTNWPVTQSVLLTNTGSLTASIEAEYSSLVNSGSASYNEFSTITQIYNASAKTLTISNQLNGPLYIKVDSTNTSATDNDYTYVLNATETYEAMQQNVRLHHGLSGSATSGRVRWTYTY
jgi:hypothetical protein